MNTTQASLKTRLSVGIFTLLGLALVVGIGIFVNDHPFWWRGCQPVYINVEDATGLKTRSPVRSLGLEIGYLRSVELTETYVRLGICVTAPVDILPDTKAYIKGEGFLGDKFVELKPVRYTGPKPNERTDATLKPSRVSWAQASYSRIGQALNRELAGTAWAGPADPAGAAVTANPAAVAGHAHDVPMGAGQQGVQEMMNQANGLVKEMTELTQSLRQALPPQELRATITQLNKTLENTSRLISPEGNLNSTAQRTLAKLEDAIEQLRDQMMRINRGEGSVGRLLNDPVYAEEIKKALENVNKLLNKASTVDFIVDIGAQQINAFDGGRGWFQLGIWPEKDRYYLLGVAVDPRGKRTITQTNTTANTVTTTTRTEQIEEGGLLLTGMLGKVFFKRLDLAAGVLYGDGAVSGTVNLGPDGRENAIAYRSDIYSKSRGQGGTGADYRATLSVRPIQAKPFGGIYLMGGIDSFRKVNGKLPYFYGVGLSFTDEDIRLLFVLK